MLETLVPSKIRRSLLGHILTHPGDRFYLRGLAKELSVTISPLRRELKRLQGLGILKAYQEANILFYVVDQTCPSFAQLREAWRKTPSAKSEAQIQGLTPEPSEPPVDSASVWQPRIDRIRRTLRPRLFLPEPMSAWQAGWPTLVGALALGLLIAVVSSGVIYLAVNNHRLLSVLTQAISTPRTQVSVVESEPDSSGQMRSPRWRLLPGAMGGFGSESSEGSY